MHRYTSFASPTFCRPRTVPEQTFPNDVVMDNQLRVWAMSRWRGAEELATVFLTLGYAHLRLPPGAPPMFQLERQYDGQNGNNDHVIGLYVTFANARDAHYLLGQVFWCGCEFIAFTTYNVFTNFHLIFNRVNRIHTLPYYLPEDDE